MCSFGEVAFGRRLMFRLCMFNIYVIFMFCSSVLGSGLYLRKNRIATLLRSARVV